MGNFGKKLRRTWDKLSYPVLNYLTCVSIEKKSEEAGVFDALDRMENSPSTMEEILSDMRTSIRDAEQKQREDFAEQRATELGISSEFYETYIAGNQHPKIRAFFEDLARSNDYELDEYTMSNIETLFERTMALRHPRRENLIEAKAKGKSNVPFDEEDALKYISHLVKVGNVKELGDCANFVMIARGHGKDVLENCLQEWHGITFDFAEKHLDLGQKKNPEFRKLVNDLIDSDYFETVCSYTTKRDFMEQICVSADILAESGLNMSSAVEYLSKLITMGADTDDVVEFTEYAVVELSKGDVPVPAEEYISKAIPFGALDRLGGHDGLRQSEEYQTARDETFGYSKPMSVRHEEDQRKEAEIRDRPFDNLIGRWAYNLMMADRTAEASLLVGFQLEEGRI